MHQHTKSIAYSDVGTASSDSLPARSPESQQGLDHVALFDDSRLPGSAVGRRMEGLLGASPTRRPENPTGVLCPPPLGIRTGRACLYGPRDCALHFSSDRPLRAVFLTSIRDVGRDEKVGSVIKIDGETRYRCGTIHAAFKAISSGALANYLDIAAIITDDMESDLRGCSYPLTPKEGSLWPYPIGVRNQCGELARSITTNIPSTFRSLPRHALDERSAAKLEFEREVYEVMRQSGADILISDHYMARLEYLIDPSHFNLHGFVLNTHPGITRSDHPFACRGADPVLQAYQKARGIHIGEDGEPHRSKPYLHTGASFHLVTSVIDEGPVICDAELTPISLERSLDELTYLNYRCSKNLVFELGMKHYAAHIYPFLRERRHAICRRDWELQIDSPPRELIHAIRVRER